MLCLVIKGLAGYVQLSVRRSPVVRREALVGKRPLIAIYEALERLERVALRKAHGLMLGVTRKAHPQREHAGLARLGHGSARVELGLLAVACAHQLEQQRVGGLLKRLLIGDALFEGTFDGKELEFLLGGKAARLEAEREVLGHKRKGTALVGPLSLCQSELGPSKEG